MGSITHVTAGVAKGEGGEEEEPPGVKILNRYEYDAWGIVTACEETVENRFRFNGQQYDPVAQQYYLRARFYNPVIGRFTQEDTYRGDGLNLYTYCRNNPVYYVDPSGHICGRRADTLMDTVLSNGELTRKERRQLEAKLRAEARNDTISSKGIETAQRMGLDIASVPDKGFTSFKDLKDYLGDAGERNAWHHIVEQSQIKRSGFSVDDVNNVNNIIALPHGKDSIHAKIIGYYSSVPASGFTNGLTVRQWLSGQSFQKQFDFGMRAIKQYGNVIATKKGWILIPFDN